MMRVCVSICVGGTFTIVDVYIFFLKQKTAYEMRISDWSSDVCSSDLHLFAASGEGVSNMVSRSPGKQSACLVTETGRSEERRVGTEVSVRVDLGGRRIIKTEKN